ncbi:MAG: hypothetical protein Q7U04_05005 [Bacteriovorax sp.]|nr:hypothetical protein [Bacteriovorax sp.]
MFLTYSFRKKTLILSILLLGLASCKQSEFYDKAALLDAESGANKNIPTAAVIPPSVIPLPPIVPIVPALLNDRMETFTQDSSKARAVDILWVVDNSGSMADNQNSLATNFNHFIGQFLDENIDFKMAFTTTDGTPSKNGKMIGDSSLLTSAFAKKDKVAFEDNFSKMVKVGINGSGKEQGLKTASSFLDLYSQTYLRQDAYLAVVFISDEEDQSEALVNAYLSRLQSVKINKGMVKAYSIVTQIKPKGGYGETIGSRYNEISLATGGKISDITDDFSATLKDIGGSIVKLVDSFALAEVPYDDTITVFVNGTQLNAGWSYDALSHSLKFNENAIPSENAKIEVHYKVKNAVAKN